MTAHDTQVQNRLVELRSREILSDEEGREVKFLEEHLKWVRSEEERIAAERGTIKQVVNKVLASVRVAPAEPVKPVALLAAPEEEEPPYYQSSS